MIDRQFAGLSLLTLSTVRDRQFAGLFGILIKTKLGKKLKERGRKITSIIVYYY